MGFIFTESSSSSFGSIYVQSTKLLSFKYNVICLFYNTKSALNFQCVELVALLGIRDYFSHLYSLIEQLLPLLFLSGSTQPVGATCGT